ncbi:MAG TPA: hypothetical protein VEO95_12560 [Chthoniobacteraceae bacterium]|nr:hypothetical protein [Chthoniobacteraceae bacterium]
MKSLIPLAVAFAGLLCSVSAGADVKPIYENNFESAALDKAPEGAMAIAGDFLVKQEGGNKFLELPGEPLDTFGILFGPAGQTDLSATAKFFGTKTGRKYPAFGVSLGGVGGYRLIMSGGKKMLEIFKGDEVVKSVPFEWTSGEWTKLRLQVRKAGGGYVVEGKAWPASAAEPKDWQISLEVKDAPPTGRVGLWGSPFSGTPIRFDDLVVTSKND